MDSPEESFAQSLDLCETLLDDETVAIEASNADAIDAILARKEVAFEELRKSGESLGYTPVDRSEFASRIEGIFSAQQANLELMQNVLSKQKKEVVKISEGQARLRMVKGAYLPTSIGGDRSLN
ncbi:MAG: hypothetical protein AAEJ57_05505 [Opitutales bacterium]